jgi:cytochrome P450
VSTQDMSTEDGELEFPFAASTPWEPAPEFARLREEEPVVRVRLPSTDHAWLVTGYAANRFSRAAACAPGAPRLQPVPPDPTSLIAMDPPEHSRIRRLVSRAFNARRLVALAPTIEKTAAGLIDALVAAGPPGELVNDLALPLPIGVICELLGVPFADRKRFQQLADAVLSLTAHRKDEVLDARQELNTYFGRLIEDKSREPKQDLLSELVTAQEKSDVLTVEELVALGRTLLTAGFHTTSNQITLAALFLLRHPEQLRRLADSPELVEPTVEELLRVNPLTVGGGLIRIATEDVEVDGVRIAAGDAVLPAVGSANRDAAFFARPDEFRPERTDNAHIAFGHGAHYCLGAQLARLELRAAVGELARRLPNLRLAVPLAGLPFNTGRLFRGVAELPVTW